MNQGDTKTFNLLRLSDEVTRQRLEEVGGKFEGPYRCKLVECLFRNCIFACLLYFTILPEESRASWDYGDGRHGSFVLTTNATIEQLYQTVRLSSDPAMYDP